MQSGFVKVYGPAGHVFSHDKGQISSADGEYNLPSSLLAYALSIGFTQARPQRLDEPTDEQTFEVIDPNRSDDSLIQQFEAEAQSSGYDAAASHTVALGRLRHLRAGGDGYATLNEGQTLTPPASTDVVKLDTPEAGAIVAADGLTKTDEKTEEVPADETGTKPPIVDAPDLGL